MRDGKCRRCKGKKLIAVGGGSTGYHLVVKWEKCPQCNGTGRTKSET